MTRDSLALESLLAGYFLHSPSSPSSHSGRSSSCLWWLLPPPLPSWCVDHSKCSVTQVQLDWQSPSFPCCLFPLCPVYKLCTQAAVSWPGDVLGEDKFLQTFSLEMLEKTKLGSLILTLYKEAFFLKTRSPP